MRVPRCSGGVRIGSGKKSIAFKVKKKALKEMMEIKQSVTAPLENFDFVVDPLHKTAAMAMQEPFNCSLSFDN